MLIQQERQRLSGKQMLKTDIARELYRQYHFVLFEFADDLKNSNVKEISITDNAVVITTRNENIRLNCLPGEMTSALGHLILADAEKEEQYMLTALMRAVIDQKGGVNSNTVFFDIGANIGWYSIYFDRQFKGLHIHAFEPIRAAYDQLLKNLALNKSGLIQVNNFGLADRNDTVDFYVSPSLLAASSLADTFKTDDKIKIKAEIRKLDDYCRQHRIRPDLIKCDVEGAELLVFNGAEETLAEAKPLVMMELLRKWSKCFGYHPNDVIDCFARQNYTCYVIAGGKLRARRTVTDETVETNFFFLHNETHRTIASTFLA